MKKLLLLFAFVFCSTFSNGQSINFKNFKVNEAENQNFPSGTRFDFEFEIQGDYSTSTHGYHQINMFIYKNSISESNRIALSYWNREDDYDIIYNTYTKRNWWNTSFKNYSTNVGDKFYLVIEYAGLSKTLSYTYSAPSSGNADLQVDEFGTSVYSSCISCYSNLEFHLDFDGSKKYLLAGSSGIIDTHLSIINKGNANAGSSSLKVYLSKNSLIDGSDYLLGTFNISSINVNASKTITYTLFGSDLYDLNLDPWSSSSNGTYYMIIQVDSNSNVSEGSTGENNNVYKVPIQYDSNSSKTTSAQEEVFLDYELQNEKYLIEVYNTLGQKIKSKNVYKESEIKEDLPSGVYLLKSIKGTVKVFIE